MLVALYTARCRCGQAISRLVIFVVLLGAWHRHPAEAQVLKSWPDSPVGELAASTLHRADRVTTRVMITVYCEFNVLGVRILSWALLSRCATQIHTDNAHPCCPACLMTDLCIASYLLHMFYAAVLACTLCHYRCFSPLALNDASQPWLIVGTRPRSAQMTSLT